MKPDLSHLKRNEEIMDYEKFDDAAKELSTDDLAAGRSQGDERSRGAREDQVTAAIESQTSQIPSTAYLGAAIGAMAVFRNLQDLWQKTTQPFSSGNGPHRSF